MPGMQTQQVKQKEKEVELMLEIIIAYDKEMIDNIYKNDPRTLEQIISDKIKFELEEIGIKIKSVKKL